MNLTFMLTIITGVFALNSLAVLSVEGSMHAKLNGLQLFLSTIIFSGWQILVLFLSNRLVTVLLANSNLDLGLTAQKMMLTAGCIALFILGIRMLHRSKKMSNIHEYYQKDLGFKKTIELSTLTSVDAFILGIGLALTSFVFTVSNSFVLLAIFFANAIFAWLGAYLGYWWGPTYAKIIYIFNSFLLLFISLRHFILIFFM